MASDAGTNGVVMPDLDTLEVCIELCVDCKRECEETLYQYCLEMGGAHAEATHIRLMADCAQMCGVAADFMVRASTSHKITCATCAESCEAMGDEPMLTCAELCRRCAATCRATSVEMAPG